MLSFRVASLRKILLYFASLCKRLGCHSRNASFAFKNISPILQSGQHDTSMLSMRYRMMPQVPRPLFFYESILVGHHRMDTMYPYLLTCFVMTTGKEVWLDRLVLLKTNTAYGRTGEKFVVRNLLHVSFDSLFLMPSAHRFCCACSLILSFP